MVEQKASDAARELARLGAKKGGRARASVLTPEERREIARKAVTARWERAGKPRDTAPTEELNDEAPATPAPGENSLPYSMFRGTLDLGSVSFECHVLSDGRRVLTQSEVVRVLTGGRERGSLGRYMEAQPLYTRELLEGRTVRFRVPNNPQFAIGYEATLLIEICELYLAARDQGLLKTNQRKLAKTAEIVVRACAKVGIIALVDEATGYQEVRQKRALQLKLQAFIAEDMQEWARMFPEDFWYELARLESTHYSPKHRPLRWGKYVMAFVYDAIDADVGRELRTINPNPRHRQNHHQWLRDFGKEKVNNQIQQVIAVMKLCDDMADFKRKFAKVFRKSPLQLSFDGVDWRD
jgi:hypothetical protein